MELLSKQLPLSGVWAVVISYCGENRLLTTVLALLKQVDHVHIVDNASTEPTSSILHRLGLMKSVSVELLPRNMGIGFALNRGVKSAKAAGAQWVLTMDQDSVADDGLLQAYAKALTQDPMLSCLSPNILNHGAGGEKQDSDIDFAITSGNLVKLDLLECVGGYDEVLFIDGVDIDLSLRIRSAGVRIRRIGAAILYHELGHKHSEFGMLARFYTLHPPIRRFYMFRNHLILMRRFAFRYPLFMLKASIVQCLYFLAILCFEGVSGKSLSSIMAGIKAGLVGRTGAHQ